MEKISFLINTGNDTLNYTKLLLKSLKENLKNNHHEILFFIDKDNDGTVEYLKSISHEFNDLSIITHNVNPCIGYARNCNILVEYAKHNIVSFLHTDMVICPDYDERILAELEENTMLCAARIEPPLHGAGSEITITENLGMDPMIFDIKKWNNISLLHIKDTELSYFFAPNTFYKKIWNSLGGYDTYFRKSREDSDLLQRMIKLGIKLKYTFKANVYHFSCISSRGKDWWDPNNIEAQNKVQLQQKADQVEMRRFIRKWGNFVHDGKTKLIKYDIDLVLKDTSFNPEILLFIEPYFSRIWFENDNDKNNYLKLVSKDHYPANLSLDYSDDDWEQNKYLYNLDNYNDRLFVGSPEKYNIKLEINIKNMLLVSNYFGYIQNIHLIVNQYKAGKYEFPGGIVYIKNFIDISPSNLVKNPILPLNNLNIWKNK